MSLLSGRLNIRVLALLIAVGAAIAAVLHFYGPASDGGASSKDVGPFEIADVANRDFEGAPALALSFTHPMSSRGSYDDSIQVFEMPPRAADGVKARRDEDEEGEFGEEQTPGVANPQVSTQDED